MILFLEDSPERAALAYQRMNDEDKSHTIWCSTAAEAISVLWDYREELTKVMLSHDLGGLKYQNTKSDNCGTEVVRYLENLSRKKPGEFSKLERVYFRIISWNATASNKMLERLKAIGLNVEYIPFGLEKK